MTSHSSSKLYIHMSMAAIMRIVLTILIVLLPGVETRFSIGQEPEDGSTTLAESLQKKMQDSADRGDYGEAVAIGKSLLEMSNISSVERLSTLEALVSNSFCSGNVASARDYLNQIVDLRSLVSGPDHWQVKHGRFGLDWYDNILSQPESVQKQLVDCEVRYIQLSANSGAEERLGVLNDLKDLESTYLDQSNPMSANILKLIAKEQISVGQNDSAIESLQRAIEIYEKGFEPSHPEVAQAQSDLGYALDEAGRTAEAISLLERAVRSLKKHKSFGACANALHRLGWSLEKMKRVQEAVDAFQSAAEMYEHEGLVMSQAYSMTRVGGLLRKLDRHQEAVDALMRSAAIFAEHKEHGFAADDYFSAAKSLLELDQSDSAIEMFRKAHENFREDNEGSDAAWMLNWIGDTYLRQGNLSQATEAFGKCISLFQELKDWSSLSRSCPKIAQSLADNQDHRNAAIVYELAGLAFEKQEDTEKSAKMKRMQGECLLTAQAFSDAKRVFEQSIIQFQQSDNHAELGMTLFGLGKALESLRSYSESATQFLRASDAFQIAVQPMESAMMIVWAGNSLIKDFQYDEANKNFERFIPAIQALEKPDVMALQVNFIAEAFFDAKQYELAIHYAKIAGRTATENTIQREILRSLFFITSSSQVLKATERSPANDAKRYLDKLIEVLASSYIENPRPPFFLENASHHEIFSDLLRQHLSKAIQGKENKSTQALLTSLAWLAEQDRENDFVHLCKFGQDLFRSNNTIVGEDCCRIAQTTMYNLGNPSLETRFQYAKLLALKPSEPLSALAHMDKLMESLVNRPEEVTYRFQYYMLRAELASRQGLSDEQVGEFTKQAFNEILLKYHGKNLPAELSDVVRLGLIQAACIRGAVVSDFDGKIFEILNDLTETFSDPGNVVDPTMAWLFAARCFSLNDHFREQERNTVQKAYAEAKRSSNSELLLQAIAAKIRSRLKDFKSSKDAASLLPLFTERQNLARELGETREDFVSQIDIATLNSNLGNTKEAIVGFQRAIDLARSFAPSDKSNHPNSFGFVRMSFLAENDLSYVADQFLKRFTKLDNDKPAGFGWATWTDKSSNPLAIKEHNTLGWMFLNGNSTEIQESWYRGLAGIIEATNFRTDSEELLKPFSFSGKHYFPNNSSFSDWLSQSKSDFDGLREAEMDERTLLIHEDQIDPEVYAKSDMTHLALETAKLLRRRLITMKRSNSSDLTFGVEYELSGLPPEQTIDMGAFLTECLVAQLKRDLGNKISGEFSKLIESTFTDATWHRRLETDGKSLVYYTTIDISKSLIREYNEQVRLAMDESKRIAQLMLSKNQLRQIWLAFLSHRFSDNRLPQAFSVNKDKKPLLSWRVHLLPHFGEEEAKLYKEFHLDEPWDSPHNRQLISKIPRIYQSTGIVRGKTPFLIVTGPGTAWPSGNQPERISREGLSGLLVVTVDESQAVIWTKPEDVVIDPQRKSMPKLSSRHPEGAPVVSIDGTTRLADPSAKPEWFHHWCQFEPQPWSNPNEKGPEYFFVGHDAERLAQQKQSALIDLEQLGYELGKFRLRGNVEVHPSITTDTEYKSLPQYSIDEGEKPLLSWRVHLLPQLGFKDLYEKFKLDEPWDSDANRALIGQMPKVFCHPEDHSADGLTRYQMLTGKGTDYETRIGPKEKELWQMRMSRNIAVVCTPLENSVEWTRPSDCGVELFKEMLSSLRKVGTKIDCVLDNAAVLRIDDSFDQELVHDWITSEVEIRSPEQKLQQVNRALEQWTKEKRIGSLTSETSESESKLSWRVHILPYLGMNELYQRFRLNEPWDSEHNRGLLDQMPDVYSLFSTNSEHGETSVMMLLGPGTAAEALNGNDFKYGKQVLLLLTVKPEYRVPWTKPTDASLPAEFRMRDDRLSNLGQPNYSPFQGALWEASATEFHHPLIDREIRSGIENKAHYYGVPVSLANGVSNDSVLMSTALPTEVWQNAISASHGIDPFNFELTNVEYSEKAKRMQLPRTTSLLRAVLPLDTTISVAN